MKALLDNSDPQQARAVMDSVHSSEIGRVESQLARARAEHFMEITQDNGIRIVAAPVFDPHGICATIGLLSTTSNLPAGSQTRQAKLLRETVEQLSAELGHSAGI